MKVTTLGGERPFINGSFSFINGCSSMFAGEYHILLDKGEQNAI